MTDENLDRLDSWKEIAAYLKRDIRTVRRWEQDQNLPIHRHVHKKLASVYAYKSELDSWWANDRHRFEPDAPAAAAASSDVSAAVSPSTATASARAAISRLTLWLAAGSVVAIGVLGIAWKLATRTPGASFSATQLTFNTAERPLSSAAVSPDGKYLAFADLDGLAVQTLPDGGPRRITLPPGLAIDEVAWLPDSNRLLVAGPGGIWRTSVFGDAPIKIAPLGGMIAVSPHGEVVATDPSRRSIRLMNLDGENVRELSPPPNSGFSRPTWSPDGRRIAYIRGTRTPTAVTAAIESRLADGSGLTTIVPAGGGGIHSVIWLPDGRVLFSRPSPPPKGRYAELWQVHVDPDSGLPKTTPLQISHTPDFTYLRPSVTSDGKRVMVQVNRVRLDVVAADFDQGRPEIRNLHRAAFTDTDNLPTGWTNEGDAILFEAAHGVHTGIYRQTLDRQDAQDFETRSNADILQALSSPDGKSVLYLPYIDGQPDTSLMRVATAGGTPQPLFAAHSSLNWLKCSRAPANVCVLTDLTPAGLQLTAFDPTTGRTLRQFSMPPTPAPQSWDLSQDGTRIVSVDVSRGAARLRLFDLRTGATGEMALVGLDGVEFVAWAGPAADSWIVTRRSGMRGGEVLHVRSDGLRKSLWNSTFQRLGRPTPSPNGRAIAFSSFTYESCAWMLQGF